MFGKGENLVATDYQMVRHPDSHENVPPDVVKPAGVVMKTARHLHRHNNRGET
ncbi:hypothetical protein NL943_003493 [Escherichia coli]|nr:hypothetical protein [Escherichia coli]